MLFVLKQWSFNLKVGFTNMAYGIDAPPIIDSTESFYFKEWFRKIQTYVLSRTVVTTITASDTVKSNIFHNRVDCTAGVVTITLPTSSTCPGRQILITKIDSGGNAVTVARNGSDTIQGSATISLAAQWSKALLISNGNDGWERML